MADAQIDAIIADLTSLAQEETAGLALDVHANLVKDTPVDTGWAQAGWVPSVGEPYDGGGGPPGDPPPVGTAQATQEQGKAQVIGWRVGDGPVFATTNVPYIGALNAGHSPQAQPGFVQAAIEKGIRQSLSRLAGKLAGR